MAVTATLTVQESSVLEGQPAQFTFTLTNGGVADVEVSDFRVMVPRGAPGYGSVTPFYPGGEKTVAASAGTLTGVFQAVFFPDSPPGGTDLDQWTYAVKCNAHFSDGTECDSNDVNLQVTPVTGATSVPPGIGSIRLDSNNNSITLPVLL